MTSSPPPLQVITGFLGSGKTTLLARLLSSPAAAGTAVIVNEVGAVSIDHHLIETVDEDTFVLASGCVCCALRDDLVEALGRLERARTGGPPLARVILETSGIADPAPIVGTLSSDPRLEGRLRLGAVIAVVDATRGVEGLGPEATRQVELSDRVVLSKTDLRRERDVTRLADELTTRFPGRPIRRSAQGAIDPDFLLAPRAEASPELLAAWLTAPLHEDGPAIERRVIELESPVDLTALELWLRIVTRLDGHRLLRIKGIVEARGESVPVLLQSVQHATFPSQRLENGARGWRGSRLVVLSRGASPSLLDALETAAREAALGLRRDRLRPPL